MEITVQIGVGEQRVGKKKKEKEKKKKREKKANKEEQKWSAEDELWEKALQILRARGETMIFNYQLFYSQF